VERSNLAILDPQALHSIASIPLPYRVPAGFHSAWVPSTSYAIRRRKSGEGGATGSDRSPQGDSARDINNSAQRKL
jgi:hypothetical protein